MEPIIASFRGSMDVRFLSQSNAGPGAARNFGASIARGEFLAFTDDDCAPDPTWLAQFAPRLLAEPACGYGGRTVNSLGQNRFASASQLLIDYLYDYFNGPDGRVPLYASNNLVLPRSAFRSLEGFNATFWGAGGEDRELCDRWVRAGYELRYEPGAVVYHAHDLDLRGFVRQHFNYGRAALRFHKVRHRQGGGRFNLEPLAFYHDLVLYPFARRTEGRLAMAALLVLAQAANAAGFLHERVRDGR